MNVLFSNKINIDVLKQLWQVFYFYIAYSLLYYKAKLETGFM